MGVTSKTWEVTSGQRTVDGGEQSGRANTPAAGD